MGSDLFLKIISVISLEIALYGSTVTDPCEIDCQCCKYQQCNNVKECIHKCIDGYRGPKCLIPCEVNNCKTCDQTGCSACYDGFFLFSTKLCYTCPQNCKTCISSAACTSCKEGFESKDSSICEHSICPDNCICNQSSCKACINGYYDAAQSCSKSCPDTCVNCTSMTECMYCKDGHYNGYGSGNSNSLVLNNCTHKCRETCISCSSYNQCRKCKDGKYGLHCLSQCSVGCTGNKCFKDTGACNCSQHFNGSKCDECVTGKYGNFCNQNCPVHCKNNVCERSSGNCRGCEDNFTGDKCNACVLGKHGSLCTKSCPENCDRRKCEQNTGACSERCVGKFAGRFCTECIPGKFGNECNMDCPKNCLNGICDKHSGNCYDCIGNFDGDKCVICKLSFFGSNCSQRCSRNCLRGTCDIFNGRCDGGCEGNYSGDKCCIGNANCVNCQSNAECKECKPGFYGHLCDKNCSVNCKTPEDQHVNQCLSADGSCIFGCEVGFYGTLCNTTCSEYCIDNICTFEKGVCKKGCDTQREDPVCSLNSQDTQHQQWETSTKHVATASALGSVLSVSLLVNIGLLVYIVVKRIKKSRRAQTEQIYENQLATSETQFSQGILESNMSQTEAAKRCIYEEIHRENEAEHEYQHMTTEYGNRQNERKTKHAY